MDDEERLVRLTVNLTRGNAQYVSRLSELTGFTKTDCVNRAIAVYAFLEEMVLLPEHELMARDPKTGKIRLITLNGETPMKGE